MRLLPIVIALTLGAFLLSCQPAPDAASTPSGARVAAPEVAAVNPLASKVAAYAEVSLSADLSALPEGDRLAIPLLLQVGELMDQLFWKQVWVDKDALLNPIDDNKAFVDGIGPESGTPSSASFLHRTDWMSRTARRRPQLCGPIMLQTFRASSQHRPA